MGSTNVTSHASFAYMPFSLLIFLFFIVGTNPLTDSFNTVPTSRSEYAHKGPTDWLMDAADSCSDKDVTTPREYIPHLSGPIAGAALLSAESDGEADAASRTPQDVERGGFTVEDFSISAAPIGISSAARSGSSSVASIEEECYANRAAPQLSIPAPRRRRWGRGDSVLSAVSASSGHGEAHPEAAHLEGLPSLSGSGSCGGAAEGIGGVSLSIPQAVMGHLTLANESANALVLGPSVLRRMDAVIVGTQLSVARPKSGEEGGRSTFLLAHLSGLLRDPLAKLLWSSLRLTVKSEARRRWRAASLLSVSACLFAFALSRLRRRYIVGVISLLACGGLACFGSAYAALAWALRSPSLARLSPFSAACRSIVLMKAAHCALTEARFATSRHHVGNTAGAAVFSTQHQWLIRTLLEDPFVTAAAYAKPPNSTMNFATQRAASPTPLAPPGHPTISPEEVEVLVARAQHTLWVCVKGMAVLGGGADYCPSLGDWRSLLAGIATLHRHRRSLYRLSSRLGDGFAPPGSDDVLGGGQSEGGQRCGAFGGTFHELHSHAQRLSGQLYLMRFADACPLGSEEGRRQAMADLTDVMGALTGAWLRASSQFGSFDGSSRGAVYGTLRRDSNAVAVGDADDGGIATEGTANVAVHSEITAQGEDPVPLYPDESYDDDVGSCRPALPSNLADLLSAMRNKR